MTSPSHLPARDLEELSAYLDGVLPAAQVARLESRLQEDPEFRAALEQIRGVVQALRKLPAVPVPRNFTLRTADVTIRRPAAYPALSLATALATLAFVVVFGLDTFAQGISFGAQAPQVEEPMALRAAEGQTLEVPPSIAQQSSAMDTEVPPTPPAETLGAAAPQATTCPTCPTPLPSSTLEGGNDALSQMQAAEGFAQTATPQSERRGGIALSWDGIDLAKLGLGILALGLAAATLIVRRRAP